jgi:hypothetical protein
LAGVTAVEVLCGVGQRVELAVGDGRGALVVLVGAALLAQFGEFLALVFAC